MATGHRKYAVNRVGDPLRGTLCFSEFLGNKPKLFFFAFAALIEMVTGQCKNAGSRAGGYFGGPLEFSKLLLGASARTPGPLWNGTMAAESLGNAFAVRKTDRLHFCNGL